MQQSNNEKEFPGLGKIYAGEVHFSRIPVEYWQHRIQMIKALGLNALSVYIMWNYHEIQRGKFDFHTDNKNLPLFLDLAEKYEMMVLFRPGPYVCAEWDFGGMPARLLSIEGLVIRANNPKFLEQTRVYFEALVPIMNKYLRNQKNPNGCIVMLQIQNQYGFYGTDKSYMQAIRTMWKELGIKTHEYYVDWSLFITRCHWQGANIGINHFDSRMQEMQVRFFEKKGVIMGGQVYTGWMTHWTENWKGKGISKVTNNFKFLVQNGNSFAMYMVHGGTNFGLTAGANGLSMKSNDYWGAITSYDYDAPINEQGSPTQKYIALRKLFKDNVKWPVPQIPQELPMITIPEIKVTKNAKLLDHIPNEYVEADKPLVFESLELKMFNQGIVLYETQLPIFQKSVSIKMVVHDFALVYLGDTVIQVLDRTKNTNHSFTIKREDVEKSGSRFRVLVQASGHINFDKNMETDHKGLYSFSSDLKKLKWRMYKFPVQFDTIKNYKQEKIGYIVEDYPVTLRGEFQLQKTGDVYLDVGLYGKGYLWINGRNLGRYWNAGPQTRLFCPGVWLKTGKNQIHILNVWGPCGISIQGFETLKDSALVEESKCSSM